MPSYEGRRLVRPHDEIVDQGLGFDLATLVGRRQVLRALGLGVTVAGLAACSGSDDESPASPSSSAGSTATSAKSASGEIPDETAGPYPGDGSNGPDVLSESGIVRSDIRSSFGASSAVAAGVPMRLVLTITDLARDSAPFAGAAVYVWHCDREGRYSMYSAGVTDQNYLRGVQIADAAGKVTFSSIFPACYTGRWPHIHVEVYSVQGDITDASNAIATSQVALPKATCDLVYASDGYSASVANLAGVSLASDNVFGDTGGASQLGTVTGDVASGFTVALTAAIDTRTSPAGGGLAGDGRPSGAPSGGGPGAGGGPPSGPPPGGGAGPGGSPPGAPPA